MAALDGKITIGIEYRSCIVHIPEEREYFYANRKREYRVKKPSEDVKALFHCWHPVTGNAIVEYEDGTIHEVEPTQIQFVDNAMSEYVFPEMEEKHNV